MNTLLLNGVLAIIRNAPELAREYLRDANVYNISDIYVAIVKEVEKSNEAAKIECLREILRQSLKLVPENESTAKGIASVETLIEEAIAKTKTGEGSKDQTPFRND
jgi:hypothetical protein